MTSIHTTHTMAGSPVCRTGRPLEDDEIRRYAPAVFMDRPASKMSDNYTFVPTFAIVNAMRAEGFLPVSVQQAARHGPDEQKHAMSPFAKHLIRFQHHSQFGARNALEQVQVGEANEIIMLNSHNGDCAFQLMSGRFRFVCANGLICGSVESRVSIRHSSGVIHDVIEGATRVLDDYNKVDEAWERFRKLILQPDEQHAFAQGCMNLRYGADEETSPVAAAQVLNRRRDEDRSNDLWTLFNVAQENLIRGGLAGRTATGRNVRTREVGAIDSNVRINTRLWDFTNTVANLIEA